LRKIIKFMKILVAEKGDPIKPYGDVPFETGQLVGPFLLQRKEQAFKKKWTLEIKNWKRIFEQLDRAAPSAETEEKKQELLKKISLVEEVLDNEESKWS
jgi:tRNA (adenine22-N1)-methyltransferase